MEVDCINNQIPLRNTIAGSCEKDFTRCEIFVRTVVFRSYKKDELEDSRTMRSFKSRFETELWLKPVPTAGKIFSQLEAAYIKTLQPEECLINKDPDNCSGNWCYNWNPTIIPIWWTFIWYRHQCVYNSRSQITSWIQRWSCRSPNWHD